MDPVLLWPAATALIPPLAWEPPYAVGVSFKKKERNKEILELENIRTRTKNAMDHFNIRLDPAKEN